MGQLDRFFPVFFTPSHLPNKIWTDVKLLFSDIEREIAEQISDEEGSTEQNIKSLFSIEQEVLDQPSAEIGLIGEDDETKPKQKKSKKKKKHKKDKKHSKEKKKKNERKESPKSKDKKKKEKENLFVYQWVLTIIQLKICPLPRSQIVNNPNRQIVHSSLKHYKNWECYPVSFFTEKIYICWYFSSICN